MKNLLENELSDEMLDNVAGGLSFEELAQLTQCPLCGGEKISKRINGWWCDDCNTGGIVG